MNIRKRWIFSAVTSATAVASMLVSGSTSLAAPAINESASIHVAASTVASSKFVELLNALPMDNFPASHNGYQRSYFKHWTDANHDGCDTRAEVLKAESTVSVTRNSSCTIMTGKWWSAYDNVWFTAASKLDIDHFVPLSEAWKSGAFKWTSIRREAFANDLGYALSLIAVSSGTNRSKGDQDPESWMPPSRTYWCTYAATWVAVKYRWVLTVDSGEKTQLRSILNGCGPVSVPIPART
jgi:hypothetical protein